MKSKNQDTGASGARAPDRLKPLRRTADSIARALASVAGSVDAVTRLVVTEEGEDGVAGVNVKLLKELTATLKELMQVVRALNDMPTLREREEMRIASERLRLAEEKENPAGDGQLELHLAGVTEQDLGEMVR